MAPNERAGENDTNINRIFHVLMWWFVFCMCMVLCRFYCEGDWTLELVAQGAVESVLTGTPICLDKALGNLLHLTLLWVEYWTILSPEMPSYFVHFLIVVVVLGTSWSNAKEMLKAAASLFCELDVITL